MILSILVVTLDERREQFKPLRDNIEAQIMMQPTETVELLIKCDNREETTGAKRDFLLRRAMGDYVVFCDCDDEISPFYISEIVKAAKEGSDCMAINGKMTTDGIHPIRWKISKDYPNVTVWDNGEHVYLRTTNHISPVLRDIAVLGGFPDIRNGEDKAYSESIHPHLKTETIIHTPLYHYKFRNIPKLYK